MQAKLRLHVAPRHARLACSDLGLGGGSCGPARSRDLGGKNGRIAFASTPTLTDESKFEIYRMRADGSDARRLTNNAAFDAGPTFSPDGERIAFVSHRDGNYEIYLMNADGTDQQRLTHNAASDREPAFSPNGDRIAFASDRRNGHFQIYLDERQRDPPTPTHSQAPPGR